MRDTRHPHPHIDPRQPRHETQVGTNPPVFAWKPIGEGIPFRLEVARDSLFETACIAVEALDDPVYLPERVFDEGVYYWRWFEGDAVSETFQFEVGEEAVALEIPLVDTWLERFSSGHPRLLMRPEDVDGFRRDRADSDEPIVRQLIADADQLLLEAHQIEEPPYLADRTVDYAAFWNVWYPTMWGSRRFVKGAETLGLAWLVTGHAPYARAACERMASIAEWDPMGSSSLGHNDEAHMSVIWHGCHACDYVWDQFTDAEREKVIGQFRRRGEITYEHMHDRGTYGITRFDSHAGREIVFLAFIGLTFHEHIPEAKKWLAWLRPVLCGLWPSWAGDDGGWAQGLSYAQAYVGIMTMFTSALKRGTGIDLYERPFWKNHARWRRAVLPAYAQWMGFGDHSERWRSAWLRGADLADLIGRETATDEFVGYAEALRSEAEDMTTPEERLMPGVSSELLTAPDLRVARRDGTGQAPSMLSVFADVGWAAIRTDPEVRHRDVAFIFRSSPFGSISHSHANNNDFILHVAGEVMAMPSGYYAGYGSDHHAHWVWHTKSHNCLTLSDAPQIMRSPESVGAIEHAHEDEALIYFRGTADASYADRADRCRRHVLFAKEQRYLVLVDELVAKRGMASALQWNIHSWGAFETDGERAFWTERGNSTLYGHMMHNRAGFFSLTEGWDPPPMRGKDSAQWLQQYHLRFTPNGIEVPKRNLGVVLCWDHAGWSKPAVETHLHGDTEVAQVGDDLVLVNGGTGISYREHVSDAVVWMSIGGRKYAVRDEGLIRQP